MATPAFAFTARYVAETLGVDQDLVEEIAAMEMEPEDGRISILDSDDENAPAVTAFTRFGIECLRELLTEHAANVSPPQP